MQKIFPIVRCNELQDLECKEFALYRYGRAVPAFIVKKDDSFFGYVNRCPHLGRPLQWNPNVFLDKDKKNIQCTAHGALFEITTGLCTAGPCLGANLVGLKIQVINQIVSIVND